MPKIARYRRAVFLLLLYQGPVFLLFTGITGYQYRYLLLAIVSLIIAGYLYFQNYSLEELGFRNVNIRTDAIYNLALCTIVVILLLAAKKFNLIREPTIPEWKAFFLFYIFISGPLQEFLFRSLIFLELKKIGFNSFWLVMISTINFAMMHIIYHDWITFLAAFLVGLCLGFIYSRTRSIYGVSVSHAVIGAVSIYVGLV